MSETNPNPDPGPAPAPGIPCRHLRTKSMYVYTDGSYDLMNRDDDGSIYWCLHTMKNFGPDDDFVDREGCCNNGSRSCYEPL